MEKYAHSITAIKILIPGKREKLPDQLWFENLGTFLKTNPNDNEFRGKLSIDNPEGLWKFRPKKLKALDYIMQDFPHTESVGDHTYHVVMNLQTSFKENELYSDVNYLIKKPDMVRVIRVAALFHDNGKRYGAGKDGHAYDSAQEVEHYLKWMDFNDKEIKLCLHLIAHHDILGKAANPHAKETVEDIIKICPTPSILQCLWILTMADIRSIEGLMKIPNILKNITEITRAADDRLEKIKERRLFSLPISVKQSKLTVR